MIHNIYHQNFSIYVQSKTNYQVKLNHRYTVPVKILSGVKDFAHTFENVW